MGEESLRFMRQMRQVPLKGPEKNVLNIFAFYVNDEHIAWPSVGEIAYESGLGESTVRRAMKRLTELGILVKVENETYKDGAKYLIKIRHLELRKYKGKGVSEREGYQSGTPEENPGEGDGGVPERAEGVSERQEGVSEREGEGCRSGAEGCRYDTQTLKNSHFNSQEELSVNSHAPTRAHAREEEKTKGSLRTRRITTLTETEISASSAQIAIAWKKVFGVPADIEADIRKPLRNGIYLPEWFLLALASIAGAGPAVTNPPAATQVQILMLAWKDGRNPPSEGGMEWARGMLSQQAPATAIVGEDTAAEQDSLATVPADDSNPDSGRRRSA